MDELSERQAQILDVISRHIADSGYPPTVREIGMAVGLTSPSTVHAHLSRLEEGGYIKRDPTKPRAMWVSATDTGPAPSPGDVSGESLPIVGSVAAGYPRLAEENVEEWVSTPFAGDYVLRVTGDSMMDAGILDGDMVAVRRQTSADVGEIVVAMIEDEATVKTFRRDGDRPVLQPENPDFDPIPADDAQILGVVVGVMRAL